ncbi:MAG: hypothetical protein II727_01980, partial [Oscillospiraceae bacterium]|nr:hypothetical protein [Oscillospiraceae bacterium]
MTRKELRIAAKQYMAAWLSSVPESEENANPLSESFEKNVQPVLTTGSRRARQRAMLYRAAAAVLAVVIAAAAFVAAIPSARAAFTAWIRTITDRSVIYTTQDKIESEASLPGIKIIYIPDGFNLEGDSMAQDPNFRILSFV